MTGLLRGELIKLRTTRTAIGFGLLTLALLALPVLAQTLLGDPLSAAEQRDAVTVPWPIPVLPILFGVVGATGEHRHGTISSVFLVSPDRLRATAAKLLAYAAAGAIGGLLIQACALIIGLPIMATHHGLALTVGDIAAVTGSTVAAFAFGAALGVAIGAIVRNQAAAVVGALAFLLILEPIVAAFSDVGEWTVSGAFVVLTAVADPGELDYGPGLAVVLLLGLTVVLGAFAVVSDRLRDI
jgi:ABC-2 type transport system permease protein